MATSTKQKRTRATITETSSRTSNETSNESVEVGELIQIDPAEIIIGTNVRTDVQHDKDFERSVKARGVLEPVTVYRDEQGRCVLVRGQRRTLTAARIGTPMGTIPARVLPQPEDADRIGDQMVENIHRAAMREAEVVAGVEQLALLGVSAAQIAKRTGIKRPTVDAALTVTKADQSRNRLEVGDLTLEEAAIFAAFEHDPRAVERLERCKWNRSSLLHEAQRLRDAAAERAAYDAEVERLRGQGLPVLSFEEAREANSHAAPLVEDMLTTDGEPVPAEEWPNLSGVAVVVSEEWEYPENEETPGADTEGAGTDTEGGNTEDREEFYDPDPVKVYRAAWVVTDVEISGLVPAHGSAVPVTGETQGDPTESEEQAETRRCERRRVIANNKAWTSAETVRRQWLGAFVTRKSVPKGAEALICEAVLTGNHTLSKAMERRHPMLVDLLGVEATPGYYGGTEDCRALATKATTPKAATMTTLAAVIARWVASTGKHTWRNPSGWDARVLGSLIEWGYEPSDVERLLLGEEPGPEESDAQAVGDTGAV